MQGVFWLCADQDDSHSHAGPAGLDRVSPSGAEDLGYRVEVWDAEGRQPELLVAIATTPSLGYAAYYAAAREFVGRDITLTHKGATLSRWRARMA